MGVHKNKYGDSDPSSQNDDIEGSKDDGRGKSESRRGKPCGLLHGAEAVGVEGDVVVVDVEGDGGGAAEEEADGEVGEGADEAGGLGGGFVGEGRIHDLLAVDPEGFLVGLVVELPLEEEPAAEGDGGAGVPVFGAVDLRR